MKLALVQQKITTVTPPATSTESYRTNPTSGLSMSFDDYGTIAASPYLPTDQRLEDGHGLTWRTTPVKAPVTIAGPTQLHLVAASTSTDTDWIAKLADVAPDGTETLISSGYLRASHRQLDPARSTPGSPYHLHANPTPIKPGQYDDYDIGIWPTAYQLAAGHALQLRLTSIDVPTHAPAAIKVDATSLTGSGVDVTPLEPATNTVREGGADPTSLSVPVLGAHAVLGSGPPAADNNRSTSSATARSSSTGGRDLAFTGGNPAIPAVGAGLALFGLLAGRAARRRRVRS